MSGPYRVRHIAVHNRAVVTNQVPSGLNRGFGGPQFYFPLERMMDNAARELRHRSGRAETAQCRSRRRISLRHAKRLLARERKLRKEHQRSRSRPPAIRRWSTERDAARRAGRKFGIGIALAVETSGIQHGLRQSRAHAGATVEILAEIRSQCACARNHGSARFDHRAHRQPAERAGPQDRGGADRCRRNGPKTERNLRRFRARHFRRLLVDHVWQLLQSLFDRGDVGSRNVGTQGRRKIARGCGAGPGRDARAVQLANGLASAPGGRNEPIPIRRLAAQLHWDSDNFPDGVDGPISETGGVLARWPQVPDKADRMRSSLTYSFQCDLTAVEVDPRTGGTTCAQICSVHDAGNLLNPAIVEGQIRGGFAHGFGAAMMERFIYAADGDATVRHFPGLYVPNRTGIAGALIAH